MVEEEKLGNGNIKTPARKKRGNKSVQVFSL